jgi:hypothetical protein
MKKKRRFVSTTDEEIEQKRFKMNAQKTIKQNIAAESPSSIVRGKNLVTVSSYRSAASYKNVISSRDRLWLFRQ